MPQLKIEDVGTCTTCNNKDTLFCVHTTHQKKHPEEGCPDWKKFSDKKFFEFLKQQAKDIKNG